MLELALKTLLSYLLGSVAGALILGQLLGFDIRQAGSGNAGATNALRTKGPVFAIAVLLIDMGKGYFAAAWLPPLALGLIAFDDRMTLAVLCACAAVLGHVYPLWYGFRGGKGAATLLGVLAGLQAGLVLPVVAVWVLVVAATGYVSLATMLAVASFSVWIIGCRLIGWDYPRMDTVQPLLAFGLWAMLLTLYTHRTNIGRLRSGQESRTRFVRTPRS